MKVTYLNVTTTKGPATYACIKGDALEMRLLVEDMTPQSLLAVAKETRENAQRLLRRANLIEQAALTLD
jgi:hypothetical protein